MDSLIFNILILVDVPQPPLLKAERLCDRANRSNNIDVRITICLQANAGHLVGAAACGVDSAFRLCIHGTPPSATRRYSDVHSNAYLQEATLEVPVNPLGRQLLAGSPAGTLELYLPKSHHNRSLRIALLSSTTRDSSSAFSALSSICSATQQPLSSPSNSICLAA